MNTITPQKNPWEWEHGWLRQSHDKSKKANVVIKVGGSLFSTSGWQHAVQSLIADEALSNHSVVVIAGGGALVDGLRLIDSNSSLPSPLMHGLALEAMGITAQFLASTLKLPLREEVGADSPFVLNMRKWGAAANARAGEGNDEVLPVVRLQRPHQSHITLLLGVIQRCAAPLRYHVDVGTFS